MLNTRFMAANAIGSPSKVAHRSPTPLAAIALGAFALGALAMGAVAIGYLAINRVAVKRAKIKSLEIGELVVGKSQGLKDTVKPQLLQP